MTEPRDASLAYASLQAYRRDLDEEFQVLEVDDDVEDDVED